MSLKVNELQFLDDQLYTKAKVIDFNYEMIKDKDFVLEVLERIESLEKEVEESKEKLEEMTQKYADELEGKNALMQTIEDKESQLGSIALELSEQQEAFKKYKFE